MAENILVKEILTEPMIKAGAELTCILYQMNWPVTASLWFYFLEENQWKLLITFSLVGTEGPKRAYRHIQEALGNFPQDMPKIDLQNVTLTDNTHPLISLMRVAIHTGGGISGIHFSKNVINSQVIEDTCVHGSEHKTKRMSLVDESKVAQASSLKIVINIVFYCIVHRELLLKREDDQIKIWEVSLLQFQPCL